MKFNERKKILVVDDKEKWQKTFKNLLEGEYDIVSAYNGKQAITKVKTNYISLVILDKNLQNETGFQVLSSLRMISPNLPAIICTAYADEQDETKSKQAGALDYIIKGVDTNSIERLKKSIDHHKYKKSPKIFLAYQHDDQQLVENLYNKLTLRGFLPWMDKKSTIRGTWMPYLQMAIENSDYFIGCFSPDALRKRKSVFRDELIFALEIQKNLFRGEAFIIPLKLSLCTIPEEFEKFQSVFLYEKDGFSKLISILNVL